MLEIREESESFVFLLRSLFVATILTPNANVVEASFKQPSWQQSLKQAIRSGRELCELLKISQIEVCQGAEQDFPVFAPLEFIQRMQSGNAADPLFRQVFAGIDERDDSGLIDPVGDLPSARSDGLLQKYDRRVLLITTGACAIHCRYCFRRHFPYDAFPKGAATWQRWIDEIDDDPGLDEVILSGGDPLSVSDTTLHQFVESLNAIEHVRRLRIHTRFPVVIPNRVCDALEAWVRASDKAVYFVLHFNHANEIDDAVRAALQRLRAAGATLLNQAVLLHGINDSVDDQTALCLALVNEQVMPYYLHQLDPVRGAMHFEVDDVRAKAIVEVLRGKLPGYAVPKLVRELPGQTSKTPV